MPAEPKTEIRDGRKIHFSVGAVIQNSAGEYLLIDRTKEPFGFAGLAGHVDQGENWEQAIKREVQEESGLEVAGLKLVASEFLTNNICSRGIEGHDWQIFECAVRGQLSPDLAEAKSAGWYSADQIKSLKLEPAWEHWFKKLGII